MKTVVLRKADKSDNRDIWLWRNHPQVRCNFFNTKPVPWQEHKKWFSSKIKSPSTKIYIAKEGGRKIGVIRFELKNRYATVSVNLNPAFFGRGLGSKIIEIGTDKFYNDTKLRNTIRAEIKKNNTASLKAFEKAGYEIAQNKKEKVIYEKNIDETRLIGRKIYLRPLAKKDINTKYLSWLNNPEVIKYMEVRFHPPKLKDLKNFYEKIKDSKNNKMFAIITKVKREHIGNIKLGNINMDHKYADLGIMIGEKKYWGRGYGQEACRLLLECAFKELNLNKVTLGVYGIHSAAIRAYQKVGFKIEGRIKKLLDYEGRYTDKIIMGISQKGFLKKDRAKNESAR